MNYFSDAAVQSQKVVSADFSKKQILSFGFAEQYVLAVTSSLIGQGPWGSG